MNPYLYELLARERTREIRREIENSQRLAEYGLSAASPLIASLGAWIKWIGGLIIRRGGCPQALVVAEEGDSASDVA
jgi:hypothetical protein